MNIDIHDKHFIRKANDGYSPCIAGNNAYGLRPFDGSVLPNCVGMATGLYNLIAAETDPECATACKYLGNRNAKDFTYFVKSQNLKTGQTPKRGACMVWGGNGDGHVAVVKTDIDPDTVITLESGWNYRGQPIVREITRKRGSGNWGMSTAYPFIYFIYQPNEAPEPEVIYYTIKRGDTLTKIAKLFNTTVAKLVEWNNIKNPNLIITGDTIIVGKKKEPIIYIVKLGDNLTKIARMFNTTVDKLVKDNHIINRNLIYVGQKIIIN